MSRKTAVTSFITLCALVLVAAPAFAQGVAFQSSSLPQQARFEGTTETMGAVVLQATGNGKIPAGSSITIVYSGTITNTSSLANLSCSFGGVAATGAGCLGNPGSNFTPAGGTAPGFTVAASGNQLTIQFTGTTGASIGATSQMGFATGDSLVISQVRVNVNSLGASATQVTATMSGTSQFPGSNPITFTQAVVPVSSVVNPSVKATVKGTAVQQTCSIAPSTFTVTVAEQYPAALTSGTDEQSFTPTAPPTPTGAGGGSNVLVSVTGVPSGVSVQPVGASVASSGILVLTPDASSTGVQTSTGTSATLAFNFVVTADATNAAETTVITFNVGVVSGGVFVTTSVPSLGATLTPAVTVSLAPVKSTTLPIVPVSFAANTIGTGTAITLGDCVTNILYPYITQQNGFDTSFSIANTTADDLAFGAGAGAQAQSGTCTLNFWPTTDTTAVTTGTQLQFTTPSIPSGGVYAFSQSGTTFSGQSGYMIAVCRFLNAHGFAFLTNGFAQASGPQLSHGYLGLILPNTIGTRGAAGGGESLGN